MPRSSHDVPPPQNWPPQITYLTSSRISPSLPSSHLPHLLASGSSSPAGPTSTSDRNHIATNKDTFPSHVLKIKLITDSHHPCKGHNGLFAIKRIPERAFLLPYLGIIHSSCVPVDDALKGEGEKAKTGHEDSDYDLSLVRKTIQVATTPSGSLVGSGLPEGKEVTRGDVGYQDFVLDIAIDASSAGNAARMINDYRNIPVRGTTSSHPVVHPNGRKDNKGGKETVRGNSVDKIKTASAPLDGKPDSVVRYATRPNVEFRLSPSTPPSPSPSNPKTALARSAWEGDWLGMEIWTLDRPIEKGEEVLLNYGKGFHAARQ